jgi:hypothetical protein
VREREREREGERGFRTHVRDVESASEHDEVLVPIQVGPLGVQEAGGLWLFRGDGWHDEVLALGVARDLLDALPVWIGGVWAEGYVCGKRWKVECSEGGWEGGSQPVTAFIPPSSPLPIDMI